MPEIDSIITTELQKFDVPAEAIASMKEEYLPLIINGLEDKEGFDKVHEARMKVKGIRINVEKRRVELKEDSLKYGRAVDAEAKRITALLSPIEAHLEAEEKRITEEKERIKEEEKRKEREKMEDRVRKLAAYNSRIFTPLLEKMTDEEFEKELAIAKENFEKEQARLAKIEEEKKAEAERIRKQAEEQETERKRLEEVRRQQEEKEAELKAAQEKIEAEKKALEESKKEATEVDIPTDISTPLERAKDLSEAPHDGAHPLMFSGELNPVDDVRRAVDSLPHETAPNIADLHGVKTFQSHFEVEKVEVGKYPPFIQEMTEKLAAKHAELIDCLLCHYLKETGYDVRDIVLISRMPKNGSEIPVMFFDLKSNYPGEFFPEKTDDGSYDENDY